MYFQLIIFIISVLGLSVFRETGSPERRYLKRKKYVTLIMILFILQSGLRNLAVGADTYSYALQFNENHNERWQYFFSNFWNIKDAGYHMMTKAFSVIFNNFRIYLIAVACFFFYALGKVLLKYLKSNYDVLVAVSLYQSLFYSFFSITGLRQTVATGLLLWSIPLFLQKRYFKVIVLFLCALLMHKSALIFLIFYVLSTVKNSKRILIIAFALFVPMYSLQSSFGVIIQGTAMDLYARYLEQGTTSGAFMFTMYILLLGIAAFFKVNTLIESNSNNYIFLNAIAVAILLTPLLSLDPNNQRIVQYFSIFSLIILPYICTAYTNENSKNLHIMVFLILAIYILSRNMEYKFFWQDMLFESEETSLILNDSFL